MTKELIESIISHVTEYQTLEEYLQSENMTAEDFSEAKENGYIQEITCGTYNGASDTFTPWNLTHENVAETIRIDMLESGYFDEIEEAGDTEADKLEYYVSIFTLFTIGQRVYIERD